MPSPHILSPPLVILLFADPATKRLVNLYLDPIGCEVFSTSNLQEAEAEIPGDRPALLMVDHAVSPSLTPSTLDHMRTSWPGVQIYTLESPHPSQNAIVRTEQGIPAADGSLNKPIQPDALIDAVQAALAAKGKHQRMDGNLTYHSGRDQNPGVQANILTEFEAWILEMELEDDLVRELTESFLERGANYLSELKALADSTELSRHEEMDKITHALKGMAGNVRFHALVEANETLRAKIKGAEDIQPDDIIPVEEEFHKVREALQFSHCKP